MAKRKYTCPQCGATFKNTIDAVIWHNLLEHEKKPEPMIGTQTTHDAAQAN